MRLAVMLLVLVASPVVASLDDLAEGPPLVTAVAFAVGDDRGNVYTSHNVDKQLPIASLTKLVTAMIVLDQVDDGLVRLDDRVKVSARAAKVFGTSALLQAGDRLTVEELLYGMLLPSGNDAALALAEQSGRNMASGNREVLVRFVDAMNTSARKLGLASTSFVDVHGLGNNLSTVTDLLSLANQAMSDSRLARYVSTREYQVEIRTRYSETRMLTWHNTNELLGDFDGLKTGHTMEAGGCLILTGMLGDRRMTVVVLGSRNKDTRFRDAYNLMHWVVSGLPR